MKLDIFNATARRDIQDHSTRQRLQKKDLPTLTRRGLLQFLVIYPRWVSGWWIQGVESHDITEGIPG